MELAPLQRVSFAHSDHTTAGGRQTPFLTRRPWKASLESQRRVQVFWNARESVKRKDGVGASSKGQRRPVTIRMLEGQTPSLTGKAWKSGGEVGQRVSYLE